MSETKLLFCGDVCFRHQKNRGPGHAASILSELETVLDSADKVISNISKHRSRRTVSARR